MQTTPLVSAKWKWRIALIGVLVVFVAFWAATFAYHRIAKARYESYVAELAAKGESLDVDDLRPPPIENPEDDVAQAPVFAEFLERCRADPDAYWKNDPVWGALDFEKVEGYGGSARRTYPVWFLLDPPISDGFELPDEEAAAHGLLAHAKLNEALLQEIREAIARPSSNFLNDEDVAGPIPDYTAFENLSLLLHREGRAAILLGQNDLAIVNAIALLQLSRHQRSQPRIMFHVLANQSHRFGGSLIREGLASGKWADRDLILIDRELETQLIETCALRALRFERAKAVEYRKAYEANPQDYFWEPDDLEWLMVPDLRDARRYDYFRFYYAGIQEVLLQDASGNRLTDQIPVPFRRYTPASSTKTGLFAELLEDYRREWFFLAEGALNHCVSFQRTALRYRVFNDHARIAIALELHRLRHGSLPATLDALTLPTGDALPLDPFTGATYVYHLESGNDYVLYSPGPNGVDEGGMIRRRGENGDWVWRLRLPADFDYEAYRRH